MLELRKSIFVVVGELAVAITMFADGRCTMLKMRVATAVVFVAALSNANARDEIFSCDELANYTYVTALSRDAGRPSSRLKEIIDEDSSFSTKEKRSLKEIVDEVYKRREISPQDMRQNAKIACLRASKQR